MVDLADIRRALRAIPILVGAWAGSCPDDEELAPVGEVDLGGFAWREVTVEATGETYSYLHMASRRADAPVAVLLHGLFLDARAFVNMQALAGEFELVAWNYPERSPRYRGSQYDIPRMLADFLGALGRERVVLVGNSLGGMVALDFLSVKGDIEVDGLVLASSGIRDATEKDRRSRIRTHGFLARRSDEFLACFVKRGALGIKRANGDRDDQHNVFNILDLKDAAFYRQASRALLGFDGRRGHENVDCPTLVLHGARDDIVDPGSAVRIQRFIPRAEVVMFPDVGHDGVFAEGERFAGSILAWWRRVQAEQ